MSYVLVGILLLLLVGGFITFLVMSATKRSDHAAATDSGKPDDKPTPFAADESPAGDTSQHAGEQPGQDGYTTGGQDAGDKGGTATPVGGADGITGDNDQDRPEGRFQRDPIGGEAEGEPAEDVGEVPRPQQRG